MFLKSLSKKNPLALFWYWLGTWKCGLSRGLKFDYLRCQFRWINLTS